MSSENNAMIKRIEENNESFRIIKANQLLDEYTDSKGNFYCQIRDSKVNLDVDMYKGTVADTIKYLKKIIEILEQV